jgi:FkbM family methyltransferase
MMGLNRSLLVRRLVRLGHPRLRELRTRRELTPMVSWIERGLLYVPQGHGEGLCFDMRHLPLSHSHLGVIAYGTLETSVQEAMVRHLGPGGVFYDIGANIGFFSLLGARLAGADGRVYAFEPAPDNAAAIRHNAAVNELSNISVIAKAAFSAAGVGKLQVVDDQSWSKLTDYGAHPFTEQVLEVELVAVDELVGELPPPTVVKIDVEGAEVAVLEGMRQTIDAHRPAIICELHGTQREFVEEMGARGYRVINLEGTIPVAQTGASAHALALPGLDPGD